MMLWKIWKNKFSIDFKLDLQKEEIEDQTKDLKKLYEGGIRDYLFSTPHR
jgi:hypothetical protein